MKTSQQCIKCGCRRILIIEEFKAQREFRLGETFYLHLWPTQSAAGKFRLFVCYRCGFAEWYAYDFEELKRRLGELYPDVRLVDNDFLDAVKALELPQDPSATFGGWKFLAHGAYDGVPLAIGERVHTRRMETGDREVMMIEVMSKTRADLGRLLIHRRAAPFGLAPGTIYRLLATTGDAHFDAQFMTVQAADVSPAPHLGPQAAPAIHIPWLDDTVRTQLCAMPRVVELAVTNRELSVCFPEYDAETFRQAVDLALRLARWPGPAGHAYR